VAVVGRQRAGGKGGRKGKKRATSNLSARHPDSKGKGYMNVPSDSKYTGRKRKSQF